MDNLSKNIKAYNRSLDQNIISEECKVLLSIIDSKNKVIESEFAKRKQCQSLIRDGKNKQSKGMDI
jgi:hypothetical protein